MSESTTDKVRPSRRQALLGDRPGSYAIAKHVRMSASKVRRVVDNVRGMGVNDALVTLQFAPQAASEPVYKVIASAVANAGLTHDLDAVDLYVSQAYVDEGSTMRRIRARAKGSASRILKRSSHITVVVEPRSNQIVVEPRSNQIVVEPRSNQIVVEPRPESTANVKSSKRQES